MSTDVDAPVDAAGAGHGGGEPEQKMVDDRERAVHDSMLHTSGALVGMALGAAGLWFATASRERGHAKLETTALYTRVATNTIREVMSPLDHLTPLRAKTDEPPA